MLNVLKAHAGAVTALVASIIFATFVIGCQVTTDSIERPGQQVTQDTLNQEIVRAQARLDQEAADVNKAAAKLAADQKQTQGQIDASTAEAQRKVNERKALIAAVPGAIMSIAGQVATGHIDPLSLAGNLIATLMVPLGLGATVDTVRQRQKVNELTKPWDGIDRRGDTSEQSAAAPNASTQSPAAGSPPFLKNAA